MAKNNIFLYGVPGSGKTTISRALSQRLGYKAIEIDQVKDTVQVGKNRESHPYLFRHTTTAWKQLGEFNDGNIITGFLSVREAIQPYLIDEIKKYTEPIIAEAAFLDPSALTKYGKCFLIVCPDEKQHYSQFFVHREHTPKADVQFAAGKIIKKYMTDEANRLGFEVIINESHVNSAVSKIISSI